MSLLQGKSLSFSFAKAKRPILKEVNFSIASNQVTVFLGVSGSGKTTLLKCIAGLLNDHTGSILYNKVPKKELTTRKRIRTIGYVSQEDQLFPHMTVEKNCTHPQRKVLGRSNKEAEEKAQHFLRKLNIDHIKDRYPSELSGGQKQRVSIARTLGMGSKVLLMDEPTSALDPESTEKLKAILLQLKASGYTLVITTHDMEFAKAILDTVYFMEEGEIKENFEKGSIPVRSRTYKFLYNQEGGKDEKSHFSL